MIRSRSKLIFRVILGSFLLQTAIPVGYMPAAVEDGWFVKLCPSGLSVEWMTTLLGHNHDHHSEGEESFVQCELGGGLGAPTMQHESPDMSASVEASAILPMPDVFQATSVTYSAHRPRSPPVFRLT